MMSRYYFLKNESVFIWDVRCYQWSYMPAEILKIKILFWAKLPLLNSLKKAIFKANML